MSTLGRRHFLGILTTSTLASLLRGAEPLNTPAQVPTPKTPPAPDIAGVMQLANLAAQTLNRDDSAAFAGLFEEDAVIAHGQETSAGPALTEWHKARRERDRETGHFQRFQILTPVIEIENNEARLTAHCTADAYHFADNTIWFQRGWLRATARPDEKGEWRLSCWSVVFDAQHPSAPPNWLHNGRMALAAIGRPVPAPPKKK